MFPNSTFINTTRRDFFFDDPFFRSTWHGFDRVHDAMFRESRDLFRRLEADFQDSPCMLENRHDGRGEEMNGRQNEGSVVPAESRYDRGEGWMFPRRWMLPSLTSGGSHLNEMDIFRAPGRDQEVIRVRQDNGLLEVSLDTSAYRPEEIEVRVEDNKSIVIEGKREEKVEDGTTKRMSSRAFRREYPLPEGVRGEEVTSDLSSDGVLVVQAKAANYKPKEAIDVENKKA